MVDRRQPGVERIVTLMRVEGSGLVDATRTYKKWYSINVYTYSDDTVAKSMYRSMIGAF